MFVYVHCGECVRPFDPTVGVMWPKPVAPWHLHRRTCKTLTWTGFPLQPIWIKLAAYEKRYEKVENMDLSIYDKQTNLTIFINMSFFLIRCVTTWDSLETPKMDMFKSKAYPKSISKLILEFYSYVCCERSIHLTKDWYTKSDPQFPDVEKIGTSDLGLRTTQDNLGHLKTRITGNGYPALSFLPIRWRY